jgi:EF-P beta-lysylation protein EpmB
MSISASSPYALAPSAATSWQQQFQQAVRDPATLCQRLKLPARFVDQVAAASFPIFAPESYIERMELGNPHDPLLRQVLPVSEENEIVPGFSGDPVGDALARKEPGLIHKYAGRVLLITTGTCAIHCRYCFRRHYPYADEPTSLDAWQPAVAQIAADASVHEIILSGGDPLSLADSRLRALVDLFASIRHLRRLRVHTRLPIVIPARVTDELIEWLTAFRMTPYVVVHANHARELSCDVLLAFKKMRDAGIVLLNQAVLLRGVNDSLDALTNLCETLSDHGVVPYYLNQLDRVRGAAHFEVPISRGLELVDALRQRLPGYAVPRYVQENAGQPNKSVLL